MQLVVWNSQGAKWDALWNHFYAPLLNQGEDVIGLVVESGWAPWVRSGEVHVNAVYNFDWSADWFDSVAARKSAFVTGVEAERSRTAFWVPWRKSLDSEWNNSRCSLGCVATWLHRSINCTRYLSPDPRLYLRPICQLTLSIRSGHTNHPDFAIFLVHLISGYPAGAQAQMDELMNNVTKIVPQGVGAIIVGDFNINLGNPAQAFGVQHPWRILRTGAATHDKGGELDYALLYDPYRTYGAATVTNVLAAKTGNNGSDHAVLRYQITL